MPLYRAGELLLVPAAATRYRDRSHFDGQNMLENGSGKPYGAQDGWLNRAILGINSGDRRLGLALGPAVPLILQGKAHVRSWSDSTLPAVDEDFLARITVAYQHDPLFAAALRDAEAAPSRRLAWPTWRGNLVASRPTSRRRGWRPICSRSRTARG